MKPEESATTGADLLVKALIDEEVEVVFGYPGGAVLPIYDSLFKQNRLRHILVRHEQAAVHAAEGYARSTGKVGVVLVTSGPGATNAVTGLTDALMDSIPIVCLTGQVPTHLIGNDAFQEADTTGITRPCTKHNYLVKAVDDLARIVHEAFYVARSGRPGPVVIDLPKDVLMNKHDYVAPNKPVQHKSYRPQVKPELKKIEQAIELIANAKRPVFYTGGGVINSGPKASKLLAAVRAHDGLSHHQHADGARHLPGVGQAVPRHAGHARHLRSQPGDVRLRRDDQYRRALRRSHHRQAHRVLARLEEDPHRHRSVSSINKNVRVDLPIVGDAGHALEELIRVWKAKQPQHRPQGAEGVVGRDRRLARRATASPTSRTTRRSSRNTRSSGSITTSRTATTTSPPRSASTRCGRRSS